MDILATLLIGALVGWVGAMILNANEPMDMFIYVGAGIIGAVLARLVFGNLLGISSAEFAGTFTIVGLFWSLLGAVLVVLIGRMTNLVR